MTTALPLAGSGLRGALDQLVREVLPGGRPALGVKRPAAEATGEGRIVDQRGGFAGDGLAQYSLGLFYYQGAGVERDFQAAMQWYRLAAQAGYPPRAL